MRGLLAILIFAFVASPVLGENPPNPHISPDGRYSINNIGDTAAPGIYFEIRTRAGKVLLTKNDKEWQWWTPTHANDIMWSSDSRFVLFRYNSGKLYGTAIYSFAERKLIDISHVIDGWTVPIRWVNSRSFVVENSGPHGGKARGGGYHYRQTYRIRMQPFRLDCVYTGPRITRKDDPDAT
jgi:hypothetical protein